MRTLLIIYPHWPPSNLAGVHRPRLIANNLLNHHWHPVILTVSHRYYEETLDWDLVKTVAKKVEIHYAGAIPLFKLRLIGDIGLRGMYFLYKKAKEIIRSRKIDFIWIPIPSFYTALLGRCLYDKFRIPYGIDYIDPWIRDISNRRNLRSVLSLWLARWLEPIAVKKASLITGVAYEYYRSVLERNFNKSSKLEAESSKDNEGSKLKDQSSKKNGDDLPISFEHSAFSIPHIAFPYGFDPNDYKVEPEKTDLPWDSQSTVPIVYAGAFLPNARLPMRLLFQSLKEMKTESVIPEGVKLYFIGTGPYAGETIAEMSKIYDIEELIDEKRDRLPYLSILHMLKNAHGVMVIGSTEPHYTASKVYQALLSKRPVMALLHKRSQAYVVLKETMADDYSIGFDLADDSLVPKTKEKLSRFFTRGGVWEPDLEGLVKYSAYESAGKLVGKMEEIIKIGNR